MSNWKTNIHGQINNPWGHLLVRNIKMIAISGLIFLTFFASPNIKAQYAIRIVVASLDKTTQGTPISGAVISKDQGDVVKITDANGDAILTNVGGSMSIKASHPDYKQFEQTFNISSDTTLYFAMPLTHRIGTWGVDDLNADWWKYIYSCSATLDPLHWKQIIPVNVRIEGASVADSLNIVAAMNTMKNSSGYDLFKIVSPSASKDTTYTIYMNTGPNSSQLYPDVNWIAYRGYSKITSSDPTKITHEIVKSQDGWPTSLIPIPLTNAEPSTQVRPPWQPLDGSYLSLKLEQDFRKKSGKQSLMIFNMQNYVALGNVGIVPIVSPANNSVDLDTLLNIIGTKDINTTTGYDFKITTDILGNNIVTSQNGVDRPRINVDLEPGKDYYIWERANGANVGSWGTPNKISTKALPVLIFPSKASISSPLNNATKVGTPVPHIVNAQDATSYRIFVAKDLAFSQTQMLKDTIVNVSNPIIPLPNGTLVYVKAIGINANGSGPESEIISYRTIKATPTLISMLFPLNNAVEVVQPINFNSSTGGASTEGYKYELQTKDGVAVLDTATITKEFLYGKLRGNSEFRIRGWAVNSDVEGPKSEWVYFKTFNNAPSGFDIILANSINSGVIQYINKKAVINSTESVDLDKDVLSKDYHVTGPSLDTIMNATNIQTVYLDSARLQPDSEYTITAVVTDGSKITSANNSKTFKTAKATNGIEDLVIGGDFRIYPNPVYQDITVEYYLLQNLEITISLYNLEGKKMICQSYTKTTGSQSHKINLTSIVKGIYIISIETFNTGQTRRIKDLKIIKN